MNYNILTISPRSNNPLYSYETRSRLVECNNANQTEWHFVQWAIFYRHTRKKGPWQGPVLCTLTGMNGVLVCPEMIAWKATRIICCFCIYGKVVERLACSSCLVFAPNFMICSFIHTWITVDCHWRSRNISRFTFTCLKEAFACDKSLK